MLAKIKAFVKGVALMAIIPTVVIAIDIVGFLAGGLLTGAVVSGVALLVSCVCVLLNFSDVTRDRFYKFIGPKTGPIDLVQTLAFTIIGFSMGVNLGLCLLIMSLNVSLALWAVRFGQILFNKIARLVWCREIGLVPA